ncbi:MAG: M48 family metalloprotease [Polyangiaceae bacterium]|nr:M48 family metalloprotease [Polyangiaceae bacterium]
MTTPAASFRRHAWLAASGVVAFVVAYLALTGYLGWTVWRLVGTAVLHGGGIGRAAVVSLPAAFGFALLVGGLFAVKRGSLDGQVEVTERSQPRLFAFLGRLADEVGAPRPHRVFVSGEVNAAVFYDLSLWNLVFPARKNLVLGLALVNTLTLDELKAVVAHEYGHFAQRTMAIGRWVYTAQSIARHVVLSRGIFDRIAGLLSTLSRQTAWIGWGLRLFMWSIRALLDALFRVVALADRALSREMELNADRVAVSVTGSESLVHALHTLRWSDEAWSLALEFSIAEVQAGRPLPDPFALQTLALEHLRRILDEPRLGRTPDHPPGVAEFRVFPLGWAQPPRMWLTHPPSREREDHAKARFVPSLFDPRPAWALFDDVPALRRAVAWAACGAESSPPDAATAVPGGPAAAESTVEASAEARFTRRFTRPSLDPAYRGAYRERSLGAHAALAQAMMGPVPGPNRDGIVAALRQLYPESLRVEVELCRDRRADLERLEGIADGVLTAPGGVVRYRGLQVRRRDVGELIETVRDELRSCEERLLEHDRLCRAAHYASACLVGRGWPEHVIGLIRLVHFSTQTARDLADATKQLNAVLESVHGVGSTWTGGHRRVLGATADVQLVLERLWEAMRGLSLPVDVAERHAAEGGFDVLATHLDLLAPVTDNLRDWLDIASDRVRRSLRDLALLEQVALDRLLEVEATLARWVIDGGESTDAPPPAVVPTLYPTCAVGTERRPPERRDPWTRFLRGEGVGYAVLRVAVASLVLFPALVAGGQAGQATVHVVNGLDVPVEVRMGGQGGLVPRRSSAKWALQPSTEVDIVTTTLDGREVESFSAHTAGGFGDNAYNVARAAVLVEWSAVYGDGRASVPPDRAQGAPRWVDAPQDYVFTKPPHQVSVHSGETKVLRVLESLHEAPVESQLELLDTPEERAAVVGAHVRFDPPSEDFAAWAVAAARDPITLAALALRADAEPGNVFLQRALLDGVGPEDRSARCARWAAEAQRVPTDADATYLAIRCGRRDGDGGAFAPAWGSAPDHPWLSWAAAGELATLAMWPEAVAASETAVGSPEVAPIRDIAWIEYLRVVRGARLAGLGIRPRPDLPRPTPGAAADFFLATEGPPLAERRPLVEPYWLLARGRLAEVVEALRDPEFPASEAARVRLLLGASDGATRGDLAAALDAPPPNGLAWVALALSIREGASPSTVGDAVDGMDDAPARQKLAETLADVGLGERAYTLDELAIWLPIRTRAVVLAMGAIVLGDAAPRRWRAVAKALLFPPERPFFE